MKTDLKEVMMFLLIGGKEIKTEQLLNLFTILADKSGISSESDFNGGLNGTTMFVEKSVNFFKEELYDEWIEFFKGKLLKIENYELVNYLSL